MTTKRKVKHLMGWAGISCAIVFAQGCCPGRIQVYRSCNCHCHSGSQVASGTSGIHAVPAQVAESDSSDDEKYFVDRFSQPLSVLNRVPVLEAKPVKKSESQEPEQIVSSNSNEKSSTSETLVAPEKIEAEPVVAEVATAEPNPAETVDLAAPPETILVAQPQSSLLADNERDLGNVAEAWQVPMNSDKEQNLLAPNALGVEGSQEPKQDDFIRLAQDHDEHGMIVLHAKVVQPLIRALPPDTRQADGIRLRPAKTVGYQREITGSGTQSGTSTDGASVPQNNVQPLPLIPPPTTGLDPGTLDLRSSSPTSSNNEMIVLKATPKASEVVNPTTTNLIQGQLASPTTENKNR